MANHGFISSKKDLSKKLVLADLQEINQRRFKGKLTIEASQYGAKGAWYISYPRGDLYPWGFNIWIKSVRKLEHRHTHNWGFYLELVFAEELGAKYSGRLTDEGFSGGWKPEPEKYPNYRAWLDLQYEGFIGTDLYHRLVEVDLKMVPEELKDC